MSDGAHVPHAVAGATASADVNDAVPDGRQIAVDALSMRDCWRNPPFVWAMFAIVGGTLFVWPMFAIVEEPRSCGLCSRLWKNPVRVAYVRDRGHVCAWSLVRGVMKNIHSCSPNCCVHDAVKLWKLTKTISVVFIGPWKRCSGG